MAGDWIQKDTNLRDKPEFIRLVDLACDLDEFQALPEWAVESTIEGLLMQLWSWVDSSTDDGHFPMLTAKSIARRLGGTEGFWSCVADPSVNWVHIDESGVSIPGYEKRFSQSAKRRISDARRKSSARRPQPVRNESASCPQNVRTDADKNRTQCGAKEEKRREDDDVGASDTGNTLPYDPDANPYHPAKDFTEQQVHLQRKIHTDICQTLAVDTFDQFWRDIASTCVTDENAKQVALALLKRVRDGTLQNKPAFFRKKWSEYLANAHKDDSR